MTTSRWLTNLNFRLDELTEEREQDAEPKKSVAWQLFF
jgi:hypothetical protein